jgi:hypothetical protein
MASVALVLPSCSSRVAHADNCVGCRGSVVGQLRTKLMMSGNLSMVSSWESCAAVVSSHSSPAKLGAIGCCGKRGQRHSPGPVVSLQPIRIALSFASNAMTDIFCKDNSTTCVHKEGETNEAAGEASHDVAYSAGCRQAGH